jgi:hypothetical protein
MTGLSTMAAILHRDLTARGVRHLCEADCEAILARVFDESARQSRERPLTREEWEEIGRRST